MNGQARNQRELRSVQNVSLHTGTEKSCIKCGKTKLINEFITRESSKDGYRNSCRSCEKERIKKWISENKEKYINKKREYNIKNKEKIKTYMTVWAKNNREKIRENSRAVRQRDPEYAREAVRNWAKRHPEKHKEKKRLDMAKKRSTGKGRLSLNISCLVGNSLNGNKKGSHWETIVGYTVKDLRECLEKQFTKGMSWANYGRNGWHVDHIIPVSVFNFKNHSDDDFKRCWALSNLQPLWGIDNIKKGNKLNAHFQPRLVFYYGR